MVGLYVSVRFSFLLSFQTGPVIQILIVTIVNTTHHRNDITNNHRHRYRYHRERQWYTTILLLYFLQSHALRARRSRRYDSVARCYGTDDICRRFARCTVNFA